MKKILYILLAMVVISLSAYIILSKNESSAEPPLSQSNTYYGNYNMIYGDWEVVGYLEGGKNYRPDELESLLGTKITYRYDAVTVNDKRYQDPCYIVYVIAMSDRWTFIGGDYYPSDESKVFDIASAYFVSIVPATSEPDAYSTLASSQIIVKDNETLILKTFSGYCVLDRISFLDDLELKIPPV